MSVMWIVAQDVVFFLLGGLTFRFIPAALTRVHGHTDDRSDDDRS